MGSSLLIFLLLVLVVSIMFSFIFSGGETSITAANTAKLNKLKLENNYKAGLILKLKIKQEEVIGSMLLGNNLLNILSSAIGTFIAVELFGSVGVFVSTIVMTIIILIFAEIIPKTYALNHPEKMAMSLGKLIQFFTMIFSPFIKFINKIVKLLLKTIDRSSVNETITPSEIIRNLILLYRKKENQNSIQKNLEVINNIIETMEIHVDKIMTHRKDIFSININLSEKELIRTVVLQDYKYIPLWQERNDNYIGILSNHKLTSDFKNKKEIILEKYIDKPIFTPETTLLSVQLHNFKIYKNSFAVIIDEYGNLKGIITLTDILEEIIRDPIYNDSQNNIKKIKGDYYIINGKTSIRDINEKLQANFPTKYNQTFAGMIIDEIERIPEEKESFNLYGYHIEILKKRQNIILLIKVSKIKSSDQ